MNTDFEFDPARLEEQRAEFQREAMAEHQRRAQQDSEGGRVVSLSDRIPVEHASEHQAVDGWDDPVPLGLDGEADPLPSGVGAFGKPLWDMTDSVAEFRQVPRSAAFLAGLPVASGAVGGRCLVQIRPGYQEQLSIYTGVGLPPGERKSATHADMRAPLLKVQDELAELIRLDEEVKSIVRGNAQKTLEEAQEQAKEINPSNQEALREAAQKVLGAKRVLEENAPGTESLSMTSDDTTDEKLAEKMHNQGGRQILLSAEGKVFRIMAGLYSGGTPNFDIYLRAHAGDTLTVGRKGGGEFTIERPVLNISLMFQPAILAEMGRTAALRDLGLIARFFLDVPEPMAGYRKDVSEVDLIPEVVSGAWQDAITGIADTWYRQEEPGALPLSSAADRLHERIRRMSEKELRPGGDMALFADWGSKLPGGLARIAATFQLLHDPQSREVSGEAMETVEDLLMPWLISSTKRALAVINGVSVPSHVKAVLAALRKRSAQLAGKPIDVRRVYRLRGVHDQQVRTEQVREALDRLADHGYVRPTGMRHEYVVHPRIGDLDL